MVSAKEGKNIADLFTSVAEQVIKKNKTTEGNDDKEKLKKSKAKKKKGTCC
jgi:hypothetical protein